MIRLRRLDLLPFALVLVLAPGCSSDQSLGERPGCLFGGVAGDSTTDTTSIETFEGLVGRRMALDRIYRRWVDAEPGVRERATLRHGRIPIVSFNGRSEPDPLVSWTVVASGAEDEHLVSIARAFASLGSPVFVIYHQNPDKDAPDYGTPAEYRAAFRHVAGVFRAEHASNAKWVWSLRSTAFPSIAADFYPGDDVVDWIGANAYNYGTTAEGSRWLSLRALVADFAEWATPHRRPLMLPEFGCTEDTAEAGHKATWFREAVGALEERPGIRAVAYTQEPGADFAVDTSPASLEAFRTLVADPYFAPIRPIE